MDKISSRILKYWIWTFISSWRLYKGIKTARSTLMKVLRALSLFAIQLFVVLLLSLYFFLYLLHLNHNMSVTYK